MNLPNGINGRLLPLGADIHPGCIDNRRHHIKIQMEKKIIITIIIIIIKNGKKKIISIISTNGEGKKSEQSKR